MTLPYPVAPNEADRAEALRAYQVVKSPPEIVFDEASELAAEICACPISYIAFSEDDTVWFKAMYGMPPDFVSCPREMSFCQHTLCGTEMLLVPDLTKDARYENAHFVVNEPYLKFYCGMPLINPDGYAIGTLCVMDFEPRELDFEKQQAMRRLARQVVGQLELRRTKIELESSAQQLEEMRQAADAEKVRAQELLTEILPGSIADEFTAKGKVAPRHFPAATVLFTDFRNFTSLTEQVEPAMLIGLLDQYFTAFDEIVTRYRLEKIKTIGDAYMAVAGVPDPSRLHAVEACMAALEMQRVASRMRAQREKARLPSLELRVGLHTGPIIAGVVGRRKFTFDIWGDAVNIAARMEANCEPNQINISEVTYNNVKSIFETTARGSIEVKNKEPLPMYFLDRLKAEFSMDPDGQLPNEKFAQECQRLSTGFAAR